MRPRRLRRTLAVAGCFCAALGACTPAVGPACELVSGPHPLPPELAESSGVAWSRLNEDVVWSVADGRVDRVVALDLEGKVLVAPDLILPGVWDVEDLAVAPCGGRSCLYLADIGDNAGTRDSVVVWSVPEPRLEGGVVVTEIVQGERPFTAWTLRYPEGAEDAEAFFVDRSGRARLVTKGSDGPARHYRGPLLTGEGGEYELDLVQELGEGVRLLADRVTGASSVPGTDRVVLRTYRDLALYRLEEELLSPVEEGVASLLSLQEPQGEAIAVDGAGRVVVTSEAGPLGRSGGMHLLSCPGLVR